MNGTQRIRLAGYCGIVGGLLWFLQTVVTMALSLDVNTPGSAGFVVGVIVATLELALILIGFLGIAWGGALRGWFGKGVFAVATLGYALMIVGGVLTLLGVGPLTDPETAVSLIFLLGRLLAALFTLLTGIAVLAGRRWPGWAGFAPLLLGLWPLLTELVPVIVTGNQPPEILNAAWGLFVALVGLATLAQLRSAPAVAPIAVGQV